MTNKTPLLLRFLWLLSLAVFPWLVLGPAGQALQSMPLRLAAFAALTLASAWLLRRAWAGTDWWQAGLFSMLAQAGAYKLASFLPDLSTYPFSLGWSEASRYYYASLFFSERLYGIAVPPSILHPTRYWMQSLPFLLNDGPLWLHRLWQVLLWLGFTGGTAALLARRAQVCREQNPAVRIAFLVWAALFLFQGPVYYHLLVMVILVLLGHDSRRLGRTLLIVLLASAWAGVSRVNWLPVPALIAACLYLIDTPIQGKNLLRYLIPPAVWGLLGTAAGYAVQQAYQAWSGNPAAYFGSAFQSDLLWYRLLPNPTYPLGILPSAVLVSLPLLGLMGLRLLGRRSSLARMDVLRLLGLAAALLALFAGGVLVSLKIGGGSNLHNLDAYLALLLVVGSMLYFGRFTLENGAALTSTPGPAQRAENVTLPVVLLLPVLFAVTYGGPLPQRDLPAAQAALQTLQDTLILALEDGGDNLDQEVLFITQRHLLTFDEVQSIPLVPDYELVFLMEMAMSSNPDYLARFHADLANQRFGFIVSEPLTTNLQGRAHAFGEENDAWVRQVSIPVLCYYEPTVSLDGYPIQILTPRPIPCE